MGRLALLKLGAMCDCDCLFCHAGGPRDEDWLPLREVCRRAMALRKSGYDGVVLSGGEPTAHRDFLTIAKFIRKSGLRLGLISNGQALSQLELREEILRCGLEFVHLSLHGSKAELHDKLVGRAAFAKVVTTVEEIMTRQELQVSVTTVVSTLNLHDLEDAVDLVSRLTGARRSERKPRHRLALIEPKGRALVDSFLLPPLADAARAIDEAIAHGNSSSSQVLRGYDGLPQCLAPRAPLLNLRAYGILGMQNPDDDRCYDVDESVRGYCSTCRNCLAQQNCSGVYVGYLPDCECFLKPVSRTTGPYQDP